MQKNKEVFESLTGIATQTAEQIRERTQEAIENYFNWLQKTMTASPWGNTDLNKKLLSYTTENVAATFAFVQKLSQAKNLEDVVKIQTEFVKTQMDSFNVRARELGAIYAEAATAATKTPFGMST